MLLYIVRHGIPDYKTDTLLEEGRKQAEAVANRLRISGIDEIHASPMGRARQTAEPLARLLGLPVEIEPWAYELGQESRTCYPDGKSKTISSLPIPYLVDPAFRRMDNDEALAQIEGIRETHLPERYKELSEGLDGMLAKLGYVRNGRGFYDAVSPNGRHVALFCHAGMMRVLLSHLFHIPFHFLAATMLTQFTGITLVYFDETEGEAAPALISYGDVGHLYGGPGEPQLHYSRKIPF